MKDFTQEQKIIKVGNSFAVTLDSKFVEANDVKAGDPVVASYAKSHVAYAIPNRKPMMLGDKPLQTDHKKLSKTEQKAILHSKITPELKQWVDTFIDENKEALEELANL